MEIYRKIIFEALQKVVMEKGYLTEQEENRDIHEQGLTHRLAYYIEASGNFSGYNIDCEYNRYNAEAKRNNKSELIKPDIIIHARGEQKHNLIIIQAKKYNDSRGEIEKSKKLLKNEKKHLEYTYAFLVIFPEKEKFSSKDVIFNI